MKRREFLATVAAVPLAAIVKPEPTRAQLPYYPSARQQEFFDRDGDIVAYMHHTMQFHVHNPTKSFRIDGIGV